MERKCGKCWKSPIFEGKLRVFISYLSEMKIVCSITLLYSSTFYSLFLPFFVLEIFKFKYGKVFVKHSASISKFEWFEQPCSLAVHYFPYVFLSVYFCFACQICTYAQFFRKIKTNTSRLPITFAASNSSASANYVYDTIGNRWAMREKNLVHHRRIN